jgi:hypothetical protein
LNRARHVTAAASPPPTNATSDSTPGGYAASPRGSRGRCRCVQRPQDRRDASELDHPTHDTADLPGARIRHGGQEQL